MIAGVRLVIEALTAAFCLLVLPTRTPDYVGVDFDEIYRNADLDAADHAETELLLGWYREPNCCLVGSNS